MLGFNKSDFLLLYNLFKINLTDRYLGSSLGRWWAIANPLFMLCLYTYIFGFVIKVRLPGAETTITYVIWLLSGLGPWLATAEGIMASTGSVVAASGIVKNMAFKTELLPIASALMGLISLIVSFCFILILLLVTNTPISYKVIFLPLIIFIQFFLIVGFGLWLSCVAVFLRDTLQVLPNILTLFMFGTPIFYSYESLPKVMQNISLLNPIYQLATAYRATLINDVAINFLGMFYVLCLAIVISYFGLKAFRRLKEHFDVAL